MSLGLKANSDGSAGIQTAGNDAIVISALGVVTFPLTPKTSTIVAGTSQATTSGTSRLFTGIPSWVKRIVVVPSGVTTSGSAIQMIQIGTASGLETSGYSTVSLSSSGGGNATSSSTVGWVLSGNSGASLSLTGNIILTNPSGNLWVMSASGAQGGIQSAKSDGNKTLSGVLSQIVYTTNNGTDTFTAGSLNIFYE